MAGWTTLRVAHAPTHRPSAVHKLHRASPPHSKKGKKETAKPFTALRHQAPRQVHNGGVQPAQTNPITTIFCAQPSIQSESVTFPKSPVTFAEIRTLGAHRLQFIYQEPAAFAACNEASLVGTIKTPAGFAVVAGVELTLLDCVRYMHRAGGLGSVAQIAKDLGALADARRLARAAAHYEGAAVRRLGYLLEQAGHTKQAKALRVYAETARHFAPLDPSVKPIVAALAEIPERDSTWKLLINEVVEVDA
jgi:hypothetical protein